MPELLSGMLRLGWLLGLCSCLGWIGWRLSPLFVRQFASSSERAGVALTCGLAALEATVYLLGTAQLLTPSTLSVALALTAIACRFLVQLPHPALEGKKEGVRGVQDGRKESDGVTSERWLARLAFLIFLIASVASLARSVFYPPQQWDSWTYHLEFPASWLHSGSIATPTRQYGDPYVTFAPLNAEILNYVLMAPLHTDFIAKHSGGIAALWGLFIFHACARRVGATTARALTLTSLAGMSGLLLGSYGDSGNDTFSGAAWLACLHAALLYRQSPSRKGLVYGAITYGLMLGVKYSQLTFQLPVALLWMAVLIRNRNRTIGASSLLRERLVTAVTALGSLLATGIWPYVRNLALAGNPLYPLQIAVGDHVLFYGMYGREDALVPHERLVPYQWSDLISSEAVSGLGLQTYGGLAIATIAGLLFLIKRLQHLRSGKGAGEYPDRILLSFCPLLLLLTYHFLLPHHYIRYLPALVFAAQLGVAGVLSELSPRLGQLLLAILAAASIPAASTFLARTPDPEMLRFLMHRTGVLIPVLVVAAVCGLVGMGRMPSARGRLIAGSLALLLAVAVLARGETVYLRVRSERWPSFPQTWFHDTWRWIERVTEDRPGIIANVGNNVPYPLRGPRLRNDVIGIPRGPHRDSALFGFGHGFPSPRQDPNPDDWMANLAYYHGRVRDPPGYLVICVLYTEEKWPYEYHWAEAAGVGAFERVHESEGAIIYRVK